MIAVARNHGLWHATAVPASPAEPLATHIEADVAIIGAGFTGLSAALHLAERGVRCVVLEAHDIGFGGSGRNVGLVNAGLWVMPDELSFRLGLTMGKRLLSTLAAAPALVFDIVDRHRMACETMRTGTLHCAVGRSGTKEIRERARQWQAHGVAVELLEERAAAQATGSGAYSAALLDRRAGTIQPLSYARGLAKAAIAAGAVIHERSPVMSRTYRDGRWALATPQGSLAADWVLICTNAYSAFATAGVAEELTILPYFNMATNPLPQEVAKTILPGGQGAWDTKTVLSSFRLDQAGRLIFGSVGALRGTGTSVNRDWGRRALKRLMPQIGEISFAHEWYGSIGVTRDALPRLHMLEQNCVSISGYNGRGIAPGTAFGRELARFVSGEIRAEDLPLPFTAPSAARFRTAKSALYEIGAQASHLTGARLPNIKAWRKSS